MNEEYKMALANEDLLMLIVGIVVFILAFADFTQSAFSFPAIVLFLMGWGIERFRRRPLPKQVLKTKLVYMSVIKILRNYVLLEIILLNSLYLLNYQRSNFEIRTGLVFLYLALLGLSLLELFGNVRAPDNLILFPELDNETKEEKRKKRFQVLYGPSFIVWLVFSSLIGLGIVSLGLISIVNSKNVLVIILTFLLLIPASLSYVYLFYDAVIKEHRLDIDYVLKATDYYLESKYNEFAYELLNEYLEKDPENVVILSKLALLYLKDSDYKNVLSTTGKTLAIIEEKELDVPHTKTRMYVFRALAFKAKGKYEEAYKAVNSALTINPDNTIARRLRRELRPHVSKGEISKQK